MTVEDWLGFRAGDIVSRDGTDRQRIEKIYEGGDTLDVICVREPESGWCKVGDREHNMARRYHYPDTITVEARPAPRKLTRYPAA